MGVAYLHNFWPASAPSSAGHQQAISTASRYGNEEQLEHLQSIALIAYHIVTISPILGLVTLDMSGLAGLIDLHAGILMCGGTRILIPSGVVGRVVG
jgi:hypothetical protein